jgi:ankyrin repeat protein
MVELMISMGSNLLATNEKKQTPFDLALEHDNINCL